MCDNIPDLFHSGYTGFSVYRGYYNSNNQLCFTYYQDLYYGNDTRSGGPVNDYNNPGDIPAITDVDGDGDLDFLSYDILGGTINYYRNMRVELGKPCDTIITYLRDRCWGKVYQGFFRTHMLGYSCSNAGLLKSTGEKTTHSGNTPCLFDWDMDGDMDYLDGSVSFNEMTFLKNGKLPHSIDSMVSQDTMWQSGGKMISIPTWPAAFNVDIDNDGKKDLLVAPNAGNSENYHNIWFYKNYTTPGSPDWRFVSDTFLVDKSIDAGTAAHPALFDYNKDGKPDLFVGSDGYRQASGVLQSRVSYYANTSTTGNPSLTIQAYNFLNLDTFNFQGATPCFGDLDNDGISDMVVGHNDGTLSFFKNYASSETAIPVFQLSQLTLNDAAGSAINVGGNAAPFIYDIDKDGKPDLVIGNLYGTLYYYRNASASAGRLSLQYINDQLGGAKTDGRQVLGCNSVPFIGKIDNTGRDYLLMGSNSGTLYLFDSIASGDTSLTYPMLDSQYSFIDTTHLVYHHPGSVLAAYSSLRSAPVVGDIDGDGVLEMMYQHHNHINHVDSYFHIVVHYYFLSQIN
ncbi:MAG: VCBS repeat-containing protein [Chitinophagia bacterium]|nr:VCBS repeat-containing protein [Chitinophagia bacterium]